MTAEAHPTIKPSPANNGKIPECDPVPAQLSGVALPARIVSSAARTPYPTSSGAPCDRNRQQDHSSRSSPDYACPTQLKGLLGHVDIGAIAWGIPHIRAGTIEDAFPGLGFVQAQDRLWQMELCCAVAPAAAEWLGPPAIAGDVLARPMNGDAASRRDFALLGADATAMLDAYAFGVNAFIALRRCRSNTKSLAANRSPGSHGIPSPSCGGWVC